MKLAFYESHNEGAAGTADLTWAELLEVFREPEIVDCAPCAGKTCAKKNGEAWSPVDFGAHEPRRLNDNVHAVTACVLDMDGITDEQLADVAQRLAPYQYIATSTHNHRAPAYQGKTAIRVIIPLSRPVLAPHWRGTLKAIVKMLGVPSDDSCKDLSRLYYLPRVPKERASEWIFEPNDGKAIDVDALVIEEAPTPAPAPRGTGVDVALPVDLEELVDRLKSTRLAYTRSDKPLDLERHEILDKMLKGESLAMPGGRDMTLNRLCAIMSSSLPVGTVFDVALEILRPSLLKTPTAPEGIDHWIAEARDMYDRGMERRIGRDMQRDEANAKMLARLKAASGKYGPVERARARAEHSQEKSDGSGDGDGGGDGSDLRAPVPASVRSPSVDGAPQPRRTSIPEVEPGREWEDLILWESKDEGKLKNCGANVSTILTYSEELTGSFRFNEVTKKIEVTRGPFLGENVNTLDVAVTDWLQRHYAMSMHVGEVGARILHVARANSYDPIADYLNGLTWDGTTRIDEWLITYADAETVDAEGRDVSSYVRMVSARWLISAVARALKPGEKVDTVLILEGQQGIKKSTIFKVLGSPWFHENQIEIGAKDSLMAVSSNWILELAELAAMRKSETESQKAFFSTSSDQFRPPYGKAIEEFPRRAVFAGTTNADDYLHDMTGNRRYWPVRVKRINLDGIRAMRDQLWAEATARYKAFRAGDASMRWWLEPDEQILADVVTEERMSVGSYPLRLLEWWHGMQPSARPLSVQTHALAETVLKIPTERITRAIETEIGIACNRIGFVKRRRRLGGVLTWVYTPTEEMLKAPQGRPNHLRAITSATATKPKEST